MALPHRKRLGDLLVDLKIISKEQLQEALQIQKKTGSRLGKILIDKGFISSEELMEVLEFQLGIPHVNLDKYYIDPEAVRTIPESLAKRLKAIPIKKEDNKLLVAMSDPMDLFAIDDIKMTTGYDVQPVIASEEDIDKIINKFFGLEESIEKAVEEVRPDFFEEDYTQHFDEFHTETDAPVAQLVNQLISQAIKENASDIHVEPVENGLRIRYRVDGYLYEKTRLPRRLHPTIVTRIKIMASLDIAEKRLPQDGKIKFFTDTKDVDLRISTLPTVYGEKVVIRILDKGSLLLNINELGFSEENLQSLISIIKAPHGMILVTGPTGSGKTTTLYSILNEINSIEKNIITLEDPVEYSLRGINQVQVNPKVGLTFASGLRSILRQDPNVIMVGEIRDAETAQIAVRGALTGHLVLSTLHTNDTASTITRLIEMGVEPFLVASSVIGVIAQRLVRKICENCKEEYMLDKKEALMFFKESKNPIKLYRGKGCRFCNYTGYKGRTAVGEIMVITSRHSELINKRSSSNQIREFSIQHGMSTLKEEGLKLVKRGITTLEEFMRVIYFLD